MRIVHVIDTLGAGGKERQLVELLKGLSIREEIVCELIVMSKDIHYTCLEDLGVKVHTLIRTSKKDPKIFFQLYKLLKHIQPAVLHSWSSMCSIYAIPVVCLLSVKFVNGFLRDAPPNLSFLDTNWVRGKLTFPFSHAIVANSQAGLAAYSAPRKKSHCVHNGFDFNRTVNLPDVKEICQRFDIETDKVVGMVASFSDHKDYELFLSAAQHILSIRDDVTFVAVGGGKNLDTIRRQVPSNYRNRIRFLGRQKQVEAIVNSFTVGVLASNAKVHGEGISNSIMEYMALAKPVIATDCGGNRELVIDGETGFIVKNGSLHDISSHILSLLDDIDLANKFGTAGRNRLISNFDLEKMTQRYLDLYRKIVVSR